MKLIRKLQRDQKVVNKSSKKAEPLKHYQKIKHIKLSKTNLQKRTRKSKRPS